VVVIHALLLIAQISAVAASRPPECGVDGNLKGTNIWERARHPELRHYCDVLATGSSKLVSLATAADALRAGQEADQIMPGHAAPLALEGRALVKLGRFTEAYTAFTEAKKRDARSLDDPSALLAFARACQRSNHAGEALAAFRSLLPRADGLAAGERAPAYVEAAFVAMSASPGNVDDAIAMLRQARREATDALQPISTLALALALDRSGARDEARAVLDDRAKAAARNVARDTNVTSLLGPLAYEGEAMAALGLETVDAPAAHDAWQRYVEAAGASGVWVDHAKARVQATPSRPGGAVRAAGARAR